MTIDHDVDDTDAVETPDHDPIEVRGRVLSHLVTKSLSDRVTELLGRIRCACGLHDWVWSRQKNRLQVVYCFRCGKSEVFGWSWGDKWHL